MAEFSSRRQSFDGWWLSGTHFSSRVMYLFRVLIKEIDHQKIAGYCAGYGPLQRSHQGVHHEIDGYGPLQSSHQGYRVLIDQ